MNEARADELVNAFLLSDSMDEWTEDEKDIEPFYKKKRFGLF